MADGAESAGVPRKRTSNDATPSAPSLPVMVPPPGASFDLADRKLGDFLMIRRLGRGGMAEVWLAEQQSLKRQVAVKVLRPELIADATYLKRFQHEAATAGAINHSNIVQVYVIGEENGVHFIAQEYVQGRNLKEYLHRKGPLDYTAGMAILKQVATALQVAGAAGIVHRDIKPENILLTKKGEVKVADFGLAQLTQGGERVELTQTGVTMGTPLYMSPEQVNGKPLDARSDIYSFGVMAYHMFAGRPPFEGETALAVAVKHLNEEPVPLKKLRPDLPDGLLKLVMRMMSKRRDDRPQDGGAVLAELKQITRQVSGRGDPTEVLGTNAVRGAKAKSAANAKAGSTAAADGGKKRKSRFGWLRFFDRPLARQATWMVPLCLLAGAAGAGGGWVTRIGNPFEQPAKTSSRVPKLATIKAQYFHALSEPMNEDVWQAVLDNFPNDPSIEHNRALLQLAILAMQSGRKDKAERIFADFELTNDPWMRDHGLAGKAYLASLQGSDYRLAETYLSQLKKANRPLDAVMAKLVREAEERIRPR